jgi:tetratricopeptide (TPR) repeat protein
MPELLPQTYLLGLIVLLGGAAVVVGRQMLRVWRQEATLARLGGNDPSGARPQDSTGLYELASVQLRKRLYGQAIDNLRKALKQTQAEQAPAEAVALIENALGFAHAAQSRFGVAIRHYRSALRARADYPVALNNLAFALEKEGKLDEALGSYEQALRLDPANRSARRGLRKLQRIRDRTAPAA